MERTYHHLKDKIEAALKYEPVSYLEQPPILSLFVIRGNMDFSVLFEI